MGITVKRFVTDEYEPGRWQVICDICGGTREDLGEATKEEAGRVRMVHDQFWHHGSPTIPR